MTRIPELHLRLAALVRDLTPVPVELPLAVTYNVGDSAIPARVTRLLKKYFEVEVPSYTSAAGRVQPAQTVLLGYDNEPIGSKRRVPKKNQNPRGPRSLPGIDMDDLQKVRMMSGRSRN